MKIYPKKLDGLDALRKEKHRLRNEIQATGFPGLSASSFEPGSNASATTKAEKQSNAEAEGDNEGILSSILSMFGDTSNISPIIDIAAPFLNKYAGKQVKKIAWVVAKDVILGYAKWKAVELSFKGMKWFINNRRKKANDA